MKQNIKKLFRGIRLERVTTASVIFAFLQELSTEHRKSLIISCYFPENFADDLSGSTDGP